MDECLPADDGGRRAEALTRLPPVYSLALRLRDARLPAGLIAECLAVESEAVGPLMALADAKLAALLRPGRLGSPTTRDGSR